MSSKDASLYGLPRPKKRAPKDLPSSSLAFTSQLSSLIASSSTTSSTAPSSGRPRPKKDDIFSTHNRNTLKRARADLEDADNPTFRQKHTTSGEALDSATWHRSKRKMEEKARLYAAMKRGDVEDADEKYAVDFDRKWAEDQDRSEHESSSGDSDNDEDDGPPDVEYTDEFGRARKGTRAQAQRAEQIRTRGVADDADRFTARPSQPANIILGDTVQSAAFNPDEPIAFKMAELAAKRDKEATPPPEEHFDGSKEIRTKGTGFYQFSADEEARQREMKALEAERKETERLRMERERRKEERRKEVEERRKAIKAKRGKKEADRFLDGLTEELAPVPNRVGEKEIKEELGDD